MTSGNWLKGIAAGLVATVVLSALCVPKTLSELMT